VKGRTTLSIHVRGDKIGFLDEAITRSGESTSAYFVKAALQRASLEARALGLLVPDHLAADIL
jgi:hypothetical protein